MMIADPTQVQMSGMCPNSRKPQMELKMIIAYCIGATTTANAISNARITMYSPNPAKSAMAAMAPRLWFRPKEWQRQGEQGDRGKGGVGHCGFGPVPIAQIARQDLPQGKSKGGQDHEQNGRVWRIEPWSDHNQSAEEPYSDGGPTPDTDLFAQQ